MRFATNRGNAKRRGASAFTLAEVLAALLFMAIVIPVAVQGLRISARAGELAERKREAARVAERLLNESLVLTNSGSAARSGVVQEADREYRWALRTEPWTRPELEVRVVEVTFPVQGEDYQVELMTLANFQ